MATRREFIKGMTGGAVGLLTGRGIAVLDANARGQAGSVAGRRAVTVAGRRVKTIDIHAHVVVPEAAAVTGRGAAPAGGNAAGGAGAAQVMGPERLRVMDQEGIDVEVLSINPNWYGLDRDTSRRLIDLQNDKLAEICAARPDRFVGMASVALQHPDLAVEQLESAHRRYGMRSAAIGGSVEGDELSAAKFDPFWAKAQELEMLVFIHPQNAPGRPNTRLQGNGVLGNVIGNPLETTIALSHLIFEGTLDRFPSLRICAAHGGGFLPSYAARSDHGCLVFPEQCKTKTLAKQPTAYLRQIYVDSLVFTAEGLRHLVAECGASQIMIGTDYPFPWTQTAVNHVLETPGLSDADRVAILGGNACRLLGIPV